MRTKLAMVFQHFNLWAHMTVLENIIEAPVHVMKAPKDQAIETARKMQIKVIGLTGFKGGKMKDMADICLVIPCDSMEMIEDVHLIINHILAGLLRGAVMYGK